MLRFLLIPPFLWIPFAILTGALSKAALPKQGEKYKNYRMNRKYFTLPDDDDDD